MKIMTMAVLATFLTLASAEEKNGFQWDFSKDRDLNSWKYFNTSPPEKNFIFERENGSTYLKTSGLYGISHELPEEIIIDKNLKRLELSVTLKQPESPAHIISIALSSRRAVVPNTSAPFETCFDSGIKASGCGFDSMDHQTLSWRKDGKEIIRTSGSRGPRNLSVWNQWVTWRLVLDNTKKTIACYTSLEPERPRLILHGTDLNGITLRSVFLPAQFACYKDIILKIEKE